VYGGVPPDGTAVRVIDWPLSIVGEEGEIAAVRAGLTVTTTLAQELAVGVPVLLSVTLTEKEVVDVRIPVV
jgi:hypothetical protein